MIFIKFLKKSWIIVRSVCTANQTIAVVLITITSKETYVIKGRGVSTIFTYNTDDTV